MIRDYSFVRGIYDKPLIIVGLITCLGAILRFFRLGYKPLWFDEAVLFHIADNVEFPSLLIQNAILNSAPPLFPILTRLMLRLGNSELILRFIPFLGSIAVLPVIFMLSALFFEKGVAYITTLFVAIAPMQVKYAQQLREYSLTFLIATLLLLLFYKYVISPTWKILALVTITMIIGIFLQYGLAVLIISLNIVYLIVLVSDYDHKTHSLILWVFSQMMVFAAVLLVYDLSLKDQMTVGWGATSSSSYLSDEYWNGTLRSFLRLSLRNSYEIISFAFPGIVFFLVVILGIFSLLKNKNHNIGLKIFLFPIFLTFLLAVARLYPYVGGRQILFFIPTIYMLFGYGISYLLKLSSSPWIILLMVLFPTVQGLLSVREYLNSPGVENLRPVIQYLSEHYVEGDEFYVYYSAKPAFTYYFPNYSESHWYSKSHRANPEEYLNEIYKFDFSGNRIWLVFSHCYKRECQIIPDYFSRIGDVQEVVRANDAYLFLVK